MRRSLVPEDGWTKESVKQFIQSLPEECLRYTEARKRFGEAAVIPAYRIFGSWRRAVEAAGRRYPGNYRWGIKHYQENPTDLQKDLAIAPVERLRGDGFKNIWSKVVADTPLPSPLPILRPCSRCHNILIPSPKKFCGECGRVRKTESQHRRSERWYAKPESKAKAKEANEKWRRSKLTSAA